MNAWPPQQDWSEQHKFFLAITIIWEQFHSKKSLSEFTKPTEPKGTLGQLMGFYKRRTSLLVALGKLVKDFDTSEEALKQAVVILCSERSEKSKEWERNAPGLQAQELGHFEQWLFYPWWWQVSILVFPNLFLIYSQFCFSNGITRYFYWGRIGSKNNTRHHFGGGRIKCSIENTGVKSSEMLVSFLVIWQKQLNDKHGIKVRFKDCIKLSWNSKAVDICIRPCNCGLSFLNVDSLFSASCCYCDFQTLTVCKWKEKVIKGDQAVEP